MREEQVTKIGKAFEELVSAIQETANDIKISISTKVSSIAEIKAQINDEFEALVDIANIADNAVTDLTTMVSDIDFTTETVDEILSLLDEVPTSLKVVDEDTEVEEEEIEETDEEIA